MRKHKVAFIILMHEESEEKLEKGREELNKVIKGMKELKYWKYSSTVIVSQ